MENMPIESAKIMIIDDDIAMMDMLSIILSKYKHIVVPFTEPVSAIEALKSEQFDILIVNYLMSPVNGDKVVELVREFNQEIYIIMMSINKDLTPSIDAMTNLDIQSYFEKSSRFDQLILTIQSGIKYTNQLKNIKNMNIQLEKYVVDFANVLLKTVDAKDNYTAAHSKRVCEYALKFANVLNLTDRDKETLKLASLFHDIGKIGIPDNILTKNNTLTDDEYEVIKYHPTIGANILSVADIFKDVYEIVKCHHERMDGSGYPYGIFGDKIPYLSKILSICDSFDAMTTKRSYKEVYTLDFALNELKKGCGTQLDKELTEKFINLVKENRDSFTITDI
jgi:putative nucleotidyltransferase with HDIG domain